MIIDLSQPTFEIIRVTSQFSNAVLVAVLPLVADVAKKLDLSVPAPPIAQHVTNCSIKPTRQWGAEISLDSGWVFAYQRGYIDTVQGPRSFFMIQDFNRIPEFFGTPKMPAAGAIALARKTLSKLDIPLTSVFADQDPVVTGPLPNGTNTIPRYRIEWFDPRSTAQSPPCVDIEVDGEACRIARVHIRSRNLERPLPTLGVEPQPTTPSLTRRKVNPEYATRLVPVVLRAVDEYASRLSLPIPLPLTTNHIEMFKVAEDRGSPTATLTLSNGWIFVFNHTQVSGFYTPDHLFSMHAESRTIRIADFVGKWNLTETQAKTLVYHTAAKLNYPTNLFHFEIEPQVHKSAISTIPRFMFRWSYESGDSLRSTISAEVDADRGEIKSFYFYDASFYNEGLALGVPLLIPQTAAAQGPQSPLAPPHERPPTRPLPRIVPPAN